MLSYRIGGLRNPTLIVPRGATIKMLFVNTDDDMFHNIRFGAALTTYPNAMTPYIKSSVGTPDLPHKSETELHGEELTLRAPSRSWGLRLSMHCPRTRPGRHGRKGGRPMKKKSD